MERIRRQMREVVQPKSYAPEAMARRDVKDRGRKATLTKLAWCPPEYIDQYRWLRKSKCLTASEAQAAILDEIASKEAKLSPFERQERALQRGAQIVANDAAPNPYAAQAKWSVG